MDTQTKHTCGGIDPTLGCEKPGHPVFTIKVSAREDAARLLDEWRMFYFGFLTPTENARLGEIVENVREREA